VPFIESIVGLSHRLDDGESSDGESTATASDVDNDVVSRPASTAVLSSDKQEILHDSDSSIKDSQLSKPSSNEADLALKSDRVSVVESVTEKPPLQPTVRLERLSIEMTEKVPSPSEEDYVTQKQTLATEHNYFSTSEPPSDDTRKSRMSRLVDDSDDAIDVVEAKPPSPVPTLPPSIADDHCYCVPFLPSGQRCKNIFTAFIFVRFRGLPSVL